jgi:flavodoxin
MLKYVLYLILAALIIGLIAGGLHLYRVSVRNKDEMEKYAGEKIQVSRNFGKVLVVYFSLTGHTREIAEKIKSETGADVYEIKTAEEMPSGPSLYTRSREQIKSGNYPALQGNIPDMESYDLVFVGAPVWWYTVAPPVLSFLNQVDFKGRKVVPFSTQGSNVGTFFEDFKKKAENARVLQGASFNNLPKKYGKAVDNKIAVWLNGLDLDG